jgi:hypothetical protein
MNPNLFRRGGAIFDVVLGLGIKAAIASMTAPVSAATGIIEVD